MKVEWIVEFTHFQFALSDPENSGDTDPMNEEEGHLVAQFVPELMDFTVLAPRYCRYSKVTVEASESPVEIDLGRISQPQAVTHQRLPASELP